MKTGIQNTEFKRMKAFSSLILSYSYLIFMVVIMLTDVCAQQTYTQTEVNAFRSELTKLSQRIIKGEISKVELKTQLNSLQNNSISRLPEFSNKVYNLIPGLLHAWDEDSTMSIYTILPGDYLSKIARKFPSIKDWLDIYELNKGQIKDPNYIYPNQKLYIPKTISRQVKEHTVSKDSVNNGKLKGLIEKIVNRNKQLDIEFGGLIVDETLTKAGRDFYETFYANWKFPQKNRNLTLIINEKVMSGGRSLVIIKVNDVEVYSVQVSPKLELIEEAVAEGIRFSMDYVNNNAQMLTTNIY